MPKSHIMLRFFKVKRFLYINNFFWDSNLTVVFVLEVVKLSCGVDDPLSSEVSPFCSKSAS